MKSIKQRTGFAIAVLIGTLELCSPSRAAPPADKPKGEPVAMEQVPEAVKKTLMAQAPGGSVSAVERVRVDGQWLYEAHVESQGAKHEVWIAQDGKVVPSKEKDDDDD